MGKVGLATPRIQAKTEIQEEGSLQIHFFLRKMCNISKQGAQH